MKQVFVTGGGGFLGRHLISHLNGLGYQVTAPRSWECDLRKMNNLDKVDMKFDVIFHLAAWTQAGDWCLTHSGEQWIENQLINTNVLAWWKAHQLSAKFVAIGTSCSYSPDLPMIEENYLKDEPIASLFTYAYTKRMLLQGLDSISKQYGGSYIYLIPSTLYGSDYHADGKQMHFIFDLVQKLVEAKKTSSSPILWGDGFQKRELIHVDDFIRNLLSLLSLGEVGCFNLGSGISRSIREYAEIICNLIDLDFSKIIFDTTKYVGARDKTLIVNKAQKILKFYENRDILVGLQDLIKCYSTNI